MRIKIDGFEKVIGCETSSAGNGKLDLRIRIAKAFQRQDTDDLDYNFVIHKFGQIGLEEYRAVLEREGPHLTIMNMNATQSSPRIMLSEHHYKDRNRFLSTVFRLIQLVK